MHSKNRDTGNSNYKDETFNFKYWKQNWFQTLQSILISKTYIAFKTVGKTETSCSVQKLPTKILIIKLPGHLCLYAECSSVNDQVDPWVLPRVPLLQSPSLPTPSLNSPPVLSGPLFLYTIETRVITRLKRAQHHYFNYCFSRIFRTTRKWTFFFVENPCR